MKLVLEGGGSRAAYTAGVLASLQDAGVGCEAVVGSSGSAINAAYFAAGQMADACKLWTEEVPKGYVSYRRLLIPGGTPALDLDRMVTDVMMNGPLKLDVVRATESETKLYLVATRLPAGEPVMANPNADVLMHWIKASSAIPVGYNRVVMIDGEEYIDGGVTCPVAFDMPFDQVIEGPTVVVLTRPIDVIKPPPNWWQTAFLRTTVPAKLRHISLRQHELHNKLMARLRDARKRGDVIVIDPPEGMPLKRLSRDGATLKAGVEMGRQTGIKLAERLKAGGD